MTDADDLVGSSIERLGAVYCGIMDVVADRLDAIAEAVAYVEANPNERNNWRSAELCYLQVRKCVEYVALALLAAHQLSDYECEKLENHYKADVIFHDLGKLNEHGFPRAVEFDGASQESGDHHFVYARTLSKRRLKRIYDDCAVHLHAGTLANIIDQTVPPYDLPRVMAWRGELLSLLSQHQVMLPHMGLLMIVWLKDPVLGRSKVVFARAERGPFQIEGDLTIYNDDECK